jgi:nucleotide-binding universal stress UspA family protein
MFDTILVAIDGSRHSHQAVEIGVAPQLAHMAEIEHLVEPPATESRGVPNVPGSLGPLRTPASDPQRLERLHYAIGEQLTSEAVRAAREAGVEHVSAEILEGDAVAALLECIDSVGADTIVMGSRGLSEVKGLLMGSVSHKVCRLAPCTCITVK